MEDVTIEYNDSNVWIRRGNAYFGEPDLGAHVNFSLMENTGAKKILVSFGYWGTGKVFQRSLYLEKEHLIELQKSINHLIERAIQ